MDLLKKEFHQILVKFIAMVNKQIVVGGTGFSLIV